MKRFTNQHEWGVVATACAGTHGLEIAFCPLCRKYEAYGSEAGEKYVLERGATKQGNHIRIPSKLAKEIILQCTCAEFEGCHKPLSKTGKLNEYLEST